MLAKESEGICYERWNSICNRQETNVQHQKGIPKDSIDDHKTYTVKKKTLSLRSLPTVTAKKPTLNFCYCSSPHFAFFYLHTPPQNLHFDTSKLDKPKFATHPRYTISY